MKILVTGGGGFIGSHLVDSQLAQGHDVRTVDLHTTQLAHVADHPRLEVITGSVADEALTSQLVQGVHVVYHLASAHLDVTLPEAHYHRVNVDATKNLLRAAQSAGVTRFVHCSSNGVVGKIEKPPVDETVACRPTNIYEETKLLGEQAALAFARETGFPVVVARPAWVYGPRCPRTAKLLRTVKKGRFIMFGNGRTWRHPIYITDAVRGLELCASVAQAAGQIYFIAGPAPVTIAELVNIMAEVQGVPAPRLRLPLWAGTAVGSAAQIAFKPLRRQPPISRRTLDFFIKDNAYNIDKARRDLGFDPQVKLRDGLELTLKN
ncbi:MAG TPA: NAD-dependent epimerase/dehydratase family protein [Chloroflexota bacterium]|nr:NAD-dependent epimerase/dehydratase family protein [Chloroflexota bacterium]